MFDTIVNIRRCRAKLVENKSQYVFLHRTLIYQLLQGANYVLPAANLTKEQSTFVSALVVPPDLSHFDVGHPGRKILSLGDIVLVTANPQPKEGEPAVIGVPCVLAITSDLVLLCTKNAAGGGCTLTGFGRRNQLNLKATIKKGDPLTFQVSLIKGAVTLRGEDAANKTQWIEKLSNIEDSFTETAALSGQRMIAARPSSKRAALQLLACPDPVSKEGSSDLKTEFGTIPLVFNSGPQADNVKAYLAYRPPAAPLSQAMSLPAYNGGVVGGMIFKTMQMQGSSVASVPAAGAAQPEAPPSPVATPMTEGDLQELIASQKKEIATLRTQLSNASLLGSPGGGLARADEAPAVTEALLAHKLRELEAAIDSAAKLEHVALGGTGDFDLNQPFLQQQAAPVSYAPPPLRLDDAPPVDPEVEIARRYSHYSSVTSPLPPTSPTAPQFDFPASPAPVGPGSNYGSRPSSPIKATANARANARASWKGVRSKAATLLAMGIRPKENQAEMQANPFALTRSAKRRVSSNGIVGIPPAAKADVPNAINEN